MNDSTGSTAVDCPDILEAAAYGIHGGRSVRGFGRRVGAAGVGAGNITEKIWKKQKKTKKQKT